LVGLKAEGGTKEAAVLGNAFGVISGAFAQIQGMIGGSADSAVAGAFGCGEAAKRGEYGRRTKHVKSEVFYCLVKRINEGNVMEGGSVHENILLFFISKTKNILLFFDFCLTLPENFWN
jgi:hypothetical protein